MSENDLPFDIPTNLQEIRSLFLETREMLEFQWAGLSHSAMTLRPGPHPEWSVKDIIAHLCWWETFAISRVAVIAAGLEIKSIENFDALNKQVDEIVVGMPLEVVLQVFEANKKQILHLIDQFTFDQWADQTRSNYPNFSLMALLGANTFGHYHEHMPDLQAFREKQLG